MTPRDFRNIHTTGNSCKDTLPCTNMAPKLLWYFYLLMEKLLGHSSWSGKRSVGKRHGVSAMGNTLCSFLHLGSDGHSRVTSDFSSNYCQVRP